jgi:hypothetical protein
MRFIVSPPSSADSWESETIIRTNDIKKQAKPFFRVFMVITSRIVNRMAALSKYQLDTGDSLSQPI